MEVKNVQGELGSLRISTSVIEKVAKFAAGDVAGVKEISVGSSGVKGLFAKTNLPKAVEINMYDGVAEVTVHIIVKYGCKIPAVCREVQTAVKNEVQNMANITVSKVNVVVAGVDVNSED